MKKGLPSREDPFAPPGAGPSKDAVLIRGVVKLSVSGDKAAYSRDGEDWDPGRNTFYNAKERRVFDGVCERKYFEGLPVAMGNVRTGVKSGIPLMRDSALLSFFFPSATVQVLKQLGHEPSRMTVSQPRAFRDGHDCVELTIGRSHPSSSSQCRIYADLSRDYLPLEFVGMMEKEVVHFRSSIAYVRNQDSGWRISTVRATLFGDAGDPYESWSFKVTEHAINKPLDEAIFTLEFPEGTHLVENANLMMPGEDVKARKYYIAQGDQKRVAIPAREYGRIPPDADLVERTSPMRLAWAIVGGCLLLMLVFLLRWRSRRQQRA